MLYSDDDSLSNSVQYEDISSHSSSDKADSIASLDKFIEQREQQVYEAERAFDFLFKDPEGPFRSEFPDGYTSECETEFDLSDILQDDDYDNNEIVEDEIITDENREETYKKDDDKEEEEEEKEKEENLKKEHELVTEKKENKEYSLKPSPATRFLDENPNNSILIPVENTVNRKELREKYISQFPGIDFFVGYVKGEATGWALVYSTDPIYLKKMKNIYPTYRIATEEDYRMFFKEQHIKNGNNTGFKNSTVTTNKPSINRAFTKTMRSKDKLLEYIKKIGGIHNAIFVAIDVEAALVLPGAKPLPLEIAMIAFTENNHNFSTFHTFIYPGRVTDIVTACKLSCGDVCGSHYIPFRNATFLRRDYSNIVKEINKFLEYERVIFVNKGSTMDVHAIRWVFAAAKEVEKIDIQIPSLDQIHCFDEEVVFNVLSHNKEINSSIKIKDNGCKINDKGCWYHNKMDKLIIGIVTNPFSAHCALRDANRIFHKLKPLL